MKRTILGACLGLGVLAIAVMVGRFALRQRKIRAMPGHMGVEGVGELAVSIGKKVTTKVKHSVGAVEEMAGKVLENTELQREGVKAQIEAKAESFSTKVEEGVDEARKRVAGALAAVGEKVYP